MKRVRITTRRGHRNPWSFVVYDSVESAFCLRCAPAHESEKMGYSKTITSSRGDILEVEWMGAEWLSPRDVVGPDDARTGPDRYDLVRIALAKSDVIDASGRPHYVEVYSGWIPGGTLSWVNGPTRDGARITRVRSEDDSPFEFSELFSDGQDDSVEDVSPSN